MGIFWNLYLFLYEKGRKSGNLNLLEISWWDTEFIGENHLRGNNQNSSEFIQYLFYEVPEMKLHGLVSKFPTFIYLWAILIRRNVGIENEAPHFHCWEYLL
jgi:hypothetical protein